MGDIEKFDEEIRAIQQRIATLEKEKRMYVQKSKGVDRVRSSFDDILKAHDLDEREFFTIMSDRIVSFVRGSEPKSGESGPRFWTELSEYFSAAKAARSKQRKNKVIGKKTKIPVIPAGQYRNPHSDEVLVKIKRPTREFQVWIDQYGAQEVIGWRQN